jgi:hypothetical protein
MVKPKVYADFHNADAQGRLRLNCGGTLQDLARQQVRLREGLILTLYADDENAQEQPDEVRVEGRVTYSEDEHCWVAIIDWGAIHHQSDETSQHTDGANQDVRTPAEESGPT